MQVACEARFRVKLRQTARQMASVLAGSVHPWSDTTGEDSVFAVKVRAGKTSERVHDVRPAEQLRSMESATGSEDTGSKRRRWFKIARAASERTRVGPAFPSSISYRGSVSHMVGSESCAP